MAAVTVPQGTDCVIRIPSVVDANGAPVNPAGCVVRSQVRARTDSGPILYAWATSPSVGQGGVAFTTGQIDLVITSAVSAAWTWTVGVFDVELTDGAGKITRFARGATVTIEPRTTH